MLNSFDIEQSEEFKTTKYFYKIHFGMKAIKDEEDHYVDLPKIYEFKDAREKEIMLNRNFNRVNKKVESLVKQTSVSRQIYIHQTSVFWNYQDLQTSVNRRNLSP